MIAPPGFTRTSVHADHALIAPDGHVVAPIAGWGGATGTILISPQMGARFSMFLVQMEPGVLAGIPPAGTQRFVYVLDGRIEMPGAAPELSADHFVYFPPDHSSTFRASEATRLLVFEKPYSSLEGGTSPGVVTGRAEDVPGEPFMGDPDAVLKVLLPLEDAFDMAINIFTFRPGATLPFVETHVMEHGLMVLGGGGVYRLSDRWYPVCRGDVIWIAPYCPQWFVAAGKSDCTYIYYKDIHRDPLVME